MKTIQFQIATPERIILKDQIRQVVAPTKTGEITVLPDHIPLVSELNPGVIQAKKENKEEIVISVSGGFIEVSKEKIVILADTAERAEEIDEERLKEARARAEESKKAIKQGDKLRFANISAKIAKEMAREKAVKKWRKIKSL